MRTYLTIIIALIFNLLSFAQTNKINGKIDTVKGVIPDKTNNETWWNAQASCKDILSTYAKKPNSLEFIKCERLENSQTIIKATYRVKGKQSKEIEDFLVENYGMGKLSWTCCGWDNAGKYGRFEHSEFKKIDTYCSAIISMYASGEVEDEDEPTGIKLETDRDKIDYFTVIVELVIV